MKTARLLTLGLLSLTINSAHSQVAGSSIWECFIGTNTDILSPALATDGTIYVTARGSYAGLCAVNTNGTLRWRESMGTPQYAPIITGDERVIVSNLTNLFAFYPNQSASIIFTAPATIGPWIAMGEDGTVYFGAGDLKVYAVGQSGTLKWAYDTGLSTGSPQSLSIGTDGTIYAGFSRKLYALTPQGTKKWAFPTDSFGHAALGRDGTVYVLSGKLYALNPESANPNGTKKWEFDAASDKFAPVIGADGTIYVAGGNYVLYAVNPNGTKKWEFQAGAAMQFTSAAIGHDGTIYVGSEDHSLYAVNPDGSYRWSFETGREIRSSPVVAADGTVYVGSFDGKLYAIKGDAISDRSPWPMFGRDQRHGARVTCPHGIPCFDTERLATNGPFDMVLIGDAGRTYGLDASTNLNDWSRLTNQSSANGALRMVDQTATNFNRRFYRSVFP